jgi:hypothetical protein
LVAFSALIYVELAKQVPIKPIGPNLT